MEGKASENKPAWGEMPKEGRQVMFIIIDKRSDPAVAYLLHSFAAAVEFEERLIEKDKDNYNLTIGRFVELWSEEKKKYDKF